MFRTETHPRTTALLDQIATMSAVAPEPRPVAALTGVQTPAVRAAQSDREARYHSSNAVGR